MSDKVYVPRSSAKEKSFQDGGSLIKLGFKADDLIAFANQHKNDKGFLNLTVSKRRTPSQYGDTHSVSLDSYTKSDQSSSAPQSPRGEQPVDSDSVPF